MPHQWSTNASWSGYSTEKCQIGLKYRYDLNQYDIVWYNHQFLDGWHWYALKIWLKKTTKHLRHLPAAPASWFLYGSDFEIRSLASANQHLSTIFGMLISWIFWIFLGIPHKPSLDTCQLQMPIWIPRKSSRSEKVTTDLHLWAGRP